MAQEPSGDARGFSPRPGPWQSDPSNGSVFLGEGIVTGNFTQSLYGYYSWYYDFIILDLVAVMFALCGLLGNGTVIWLLGFRVKRNPFSVYILNLAIADFLFLSFLIVVVLVLFFKNDIRDMFIVPVLFTSYLAGMMLLMAISMERCVSALFPIWYRCRRPAHLSAIVCAVVWGLSLSLQIPMFLCFTYEYFSCYHVILIYIVTSFLTLLVLCASSLTLLIRVCCGSWRRQTTKLYRVILLTVLAFLVLGLPLHIGGLIKVIRFKTSNIFRLISFLYIPSVLNCAVNPVIYFFVGRLSQQPGRKSLREVLQSVLTEDT